MLYNISEVYFITNIYFNVNYSLCCYFIIYFWCAKAKQYWNTNISIIYVKNHNSIWYLPIQYLLVFTWIHVPIGIVNIFKFAIHYLVIFIWRKNNIQWFFDQIKCLFVIGIIYKTSSNTYIMIDLICCGNKLN